MDSDLALFGYDIAQMLEARLTFDEAVASPEFDIIASQRLVMYRCNMEGEMEAAFQKLHEGYWNDSRKKESGDTGSG